MELTMELTMEFTMGGQWFKTLGSSNFFPSKPENLKRFLANCFFLKPHTIVGVCLRL